jgi:hypothetical protein
MIIAGVKILRSVMSPKKHPIAWLVLVLIAATLLAAWIVPRAGTLEGRLQGERQPVLSDNIRSLRSFLI